MMTGEEKPPSADEALQRRLADVLDGMTATEELYLAAMMTRWKAEWGKPTVLRRSPLHYQSIRPGETDGTFLIASGLVGLGTAVALGERPTVHVSVDDVRDQVDAMLELLVTPPLLLD